MVVEPPVPGILTIDYEDWFHILSGRWTDPAEWKRLPSHIENDTSMLLDLLDRYSARATFFAVGWLAKRTTDLLQEIVGRGHDVASHGHLHVPPSEMSGAEFRADVLRSMETIEAATGVVPRGYRAPGFGVSGCGYPFRDILEEIGFSYDSSSCPGHVVGGRCTGAKHAAPHHPDPRHPGFWEIPISATRVCGFPIASAGGGFLRLAPGWVLARAAHQVRERREPFVCYLHPRDLNPESPRIPAAPWSRVRYYGGRRSTRSKLEHLLSEGPFVSVERFIDGVEAAEEAAA